MCLAIPGEILDVQGSDELTRTATVRFGGIDKQVSLAYVPDAQPGEYVLVHVGFALNRIDEDEARRVYRYLDEIAEIEAAEDNGS